MLPLQVDNMYTEGWAGELRGGRGEEKESQIGRGRRKEREKESEGRGRGSFTGTLVKGRGGSKKALQWKPTRSCFKLLICLNGFLFVFSLRLKLP